MPGAEMAMRWGCLWGPMPRTAPSDTLASTPPQGAATLVPGTAFSRAGASRPGTSTAPDLQLPDHCVCFDCGAYKGWFAYQWRGVALRVVCHKHFTAYALRTSIEKAAELRRAERQKNGTLVVG